MNLPLAKTITRPSVLNFHDVKVIHDGEDFERRGTKAVRGNIKPGSWVSEAAQPLKVFLGPRTAAAVIALGRTAGHTFLLLS